MSEFFVPRGTWKFVLSPFGDLILFFHTKIPAKGINKPSQNLPYDEEAFYRNRLHLGFAWDASPGPELLFAGQRILQSRHTQAQGIHLP
jgi:hypothetical protein